jgi:hypothetical protein
MRVLSGPTAWTKTVTCQPCGAGLLVEMGDVLVGHFGPSWGGETPERDIYCQCSVCGSHIRLGPDVPPLVDKQAELNTQAKKLQPR